MTTSSNQPKTLGIVIKAERETQGLSLRELARLVGVSPSLVSRWEHDQTTPKARSLSALARVLELPTTDLMTLSGAEYPHDAPSLPAMLRAEYDLPPEAVRKVEQYVARVAKQYGNEPPTKSTNERRDP